MPSTGKHCKISFNNAYIFDEIMSISCQDHVMSTFKCSLFTGKKNKKKIKFFPEAFC